MLGDIQGEHGLMAALEDIFESAVPIEGLDFPADVVKGDDSNDENDED